MRKMIVIALLLLPSVALAQEREMDPLAAGYDQLLMEANRRVVSLNAELKKVSAERDKLKADAAKHDDAAKADQK